MFYTIIGYCDDQESLDYNENNLIRKSWDSLGGRRLSLNYSCVMNGIRQLKYDYLGSEYTNNYPYKKKWKKRRY